MSISQLRQVLHTQKNLELAVLVGSQASDKARADSDWDIAIRWEKGMNYTDNLANTETLRRKLGVALKIKETKVDLIDLPRAGLAMRALVAEKGLVLKGEDSLSWNHFLGRVWRELEDFEWDKQHAV